MALQLLLFTYLYQPTQFQTALLLVRLLSSPPSTTEMENNNYTLTAPRMAPLF